MEYIGTVIFHCCGTSRFARVCRCIGMVTTARWTSETCLLRWQGERPTNLLTTSRSGASPPGRRCFRRHPTLSRSSIPKPQRVGFRHRALRSVPRKQRQLVWQTDAHQRHRRTYPERWRAFGDDLLARFSEVGKGRPWHFTHYHKSVGYANAPLVWNWLGFLPAQRLSSDAWGSADTTLATARRLFPRLTCTIQTLSVFGVTILLDFVTSYRGCNLARLRARIQRPGSEGTVEFQHCGAAEHPRLLVLAGVFGLALWWRLRPL